VKTCHLATLLLLLFAVAAASPYAKDKNKIPTGRLLTGQVLDKHDAPVTDAVVYLTNARTHEVKTYIVSEDGAYHFPELMPGVDYEVYAQFKGVKSDTRAVSQFDDRAQVNIVLTIDRQ
jgi:hypothetical protein